MFLLVSLKVDEIEMWSERNGGGFLSPPFSKRRRVLEQGSIPIDTNVNEAWMGNPSKLDGVDEGNERPRKRIKMSYEQDIPSKQLALGNPYSFDENGGRVNENSGAHLVTPIYEDWHLQANRNPIPSAMAGMGDKGEFERDTSWITPNLSQSNPQPFSGVSQYPALAPQVMPQYLSPNFQNWVWDESGCRSNLNNELCSNTSIPGYSGRNDWPSDFPASEGISSLRSEADSSLMAEYRLKPVTPKFSSEPTDATFFKSDNFDLPYAASPAGHHCDTTQQSWTMSSPRTPFNNEQLLNMNSLSGIASGATPVASTLATQRTSSVTPSQQLCTPEAQLMENIVSERSSDMVGRSGSTNENGISSGDEHSVLKGLNSPLLEQPRKTRISKTPENSQDKTEFCEVPYWAHEYNHEDWTSELASSPADLESLFGGYLPGRAGNSRHSAQR